MCVENYNILITFSLDLLLCASAISLLNNIFTLQVHTFQMYYLWLICYNHELIKWIPISDSRHLSAQVQWQ